MDHLRRELAFQGTETGFRVVLKRNCSIAPAALWGTFALAAVVTIVIGSGFAAAGAWLVLPFAGAELSALGCAFLVAGRHAGDYERIELERGRLTVEIAMAQRRWHYEMRPGEARVGMDRERRAVLRDGERMVEIGRHLDAGARAGFAAELARRLKQ